VSIFLSYPAGTPPRWSKQDSSTPGAVRALNAGRSAREGQACQALKSLATHKTNRNDARGLAHLTRAGFFKPVRVKSLPADVVGALIIARKKLVGPRVVT
jgi:hypothetical protein